MAEIASAFVSLVPSARGFGKKLDSQISGDVDASGKRAGSSFGKVFAAAGGVLAAAGVGSFLKGAIDEASGLNEAGTKIEAIFGRGSKAVQAFAGQGAKALGQSRLEVLDAAATFGTFGKAAGLGGQDLAKFSTGFTSLATDLASFNNSTPEEATEALGAALRGEAEPMRRFGVLLDDATLRNEALRLGLVKTTKEALTPQQKVLAAQAAIYKQTKDAQGDFQRTSGGLANQQRILSASFTDVKAKVGEALLPAITGLVTTVNTKVVPAVTSFIAGMKSGTGAGGALASTFQSIMGVLGPTATFLLKNKAAVAAFVGVIGSAILVAKAWRAVQIGLNIALAANPIGLVVVAVAALAAGAVLAYKKSDTFRKIVDGLWAALKVAGRWVGDIAGKVISFGASVASKAMPHVIKFATFIGGAYVAYIKTAIGVVGAIIGAVVKFGGALIDGVRDAGRFLSGVREKVGGALDFVKSIPGKVTAVFSGAASLLYNAGSALMSGLAAGIRAKITSAIAEVKAGLSKIKAMLPGSPIKDGPLKPWNNGRPGEILMEMLARGVKKGGKRTEEAMRAQMDRLKTRLSGLKDAFASLSSSVAGAFNKDVFGGTLEEMFAGLTGNNGTLTQLLGAFDRLKTMGAGKGFLSSLFQSGNSDVALALAAGPASAVQQASSLFDANANLATQLGNKVADNELGGKVDSVRDAIERLGDRLDKLPKNLGKEITDKRLEIVGGDPGRQAYLRKGRR